MGKRKWSPDEKKLVVLEILRGQKSICQIAKEKGMSDALVYRWRDQALNAIEDAFSDTRVNGSQGFSSEREKFLKIIGEQACVIDTLKKISGMR